MSAPEDQENDQSMEEILQSIKRIIAEEEPEGGEIEPTAEEPPVETAAEGVDDDILELTDMVNDDGTVAKVEADTPALEGEFAMDVVAESVTQESSEDELTPALSESTQGLVSDEAASASSAALEELLSQEPPATPAPKKTSPSPQFRSGATVEDLVLEALRPMLKEWLDANLPTLVENMVRDEIKRLSPR